MENIIYIYAIVYMILGLVIYHSVFDVVYFNLGKALIQELIGAFIFACIMVAITIKFWVASVIILILLGIACMAKIQNSIGRTLVIVLVAFAVIATAYTGIRTNNGEDLFKKSSSKRSSNEDKLTVEENLETTETKPKTKTKTETKSKTEDIAEKKEDMGVYLWNEYYVVPAYTDESEDTYKGSCEVADERNSFMRHPEEHEGKRYMISCMVSSVTRKGQNNDYDIYSCLEDEYLGDFYVIDYRSTDTTRILEGDYITVYGEFVGLTQACPLFAMKYVDINWKQTDDSEEGAKSSYIDNTYLLPDSDSVLLDEYSLYGMSAQNLTYARNEIYARHGYVFKSTELNYYFSDKYWYSPNPSYTGDLSEIERKNAEFISNYQKRYGLEYKPY